MTRRLRRLGFTQATVAPVPADGLCVGRIRGLGARMRAASPERRK
jgi:hypothetical protein